ncbi:hypothetical protein FCM35_KLT06881 [Carex littledalei]|uniref:Disease resistance R13L4/SHOC-2-like LRR domain-containing protein n=1 Tax=Carex littledalei TaxID=544730 RepID=A0A833VIU8_9POAL|nr:hypothetical protein FCM35_KLT06881 [Carex littledalei]
MLSASLRSLSVHDERQGGSLYFLEYLCFPPQKLESLNLRGHLGRLPQWVANHIRLTRITLSHTQLGSDDIKLLGGIQSLLCLKLYSDSFRERELVLGKDEFNGLRVLVVHCDAIRTISFKEHATPSLEVSSGSCFKTEPATLKRHREATNAQRCITHWQFRPRASIPFAHNP